MISNLTTDRAAAKRYLAERVSLLDLRAGDLDEVEDLVCFMRLRWGADAARRAAVLAASLVHLLLEDVHEGGKPGDVGEPGDGGDAGERPLMIGPELAERLRRRAA